MENGLEELVKMGVDHVETILDEINGPTAAKDAGSTTLEATLPGTELKSPGTGAGLWSKAPLADSSSFLKHTLTPEKGVKRDKIESNGLEESVVTSDAQRQKFVDGKYACCGFQNVYAKSLLTDICGTVTLTLEPVQSASFNSSLRWRNNVNCKYYTSPYEFKAPLTEYKDGKRPAVAKSALHKFRDWHSKHVAKIAYTNAENAATSKLKAFAAMKKFQQDIDSPKSLSSNFSTLPSPIIDFQPNKIGQKRTYCTISDDYFQYLNRPKRARHEPFKIIFKAHAVGQTSPSSPEMCNKSPRTYFSWPSGKTPLPGYRPKRKHYGRVDSLSLDKKKRTFVTYRIPKPKPKPNSLALRHFPHNTFRKPVWVPPGPRKLGQDKRYFPVEKLKWDPASRRFTVMTPQKKLSNRGQWFNFPTASTKSKYSTSIRQKPAVGGSASQVFRASLSSQPARKDFPVPTKVQQNVKEVKVILKCTATPEPQWFKTMDDYVRISLLFQVRKTMAGKVLKHSLFENRSDGKATLVDQDDSHEVEPCSKKTPKVDTGSHSSLVLVSPQTEFLLTSWASRLPQAKKMDKVFASGFLLSKKSEKTTELSSSWLHICKSGFVEKPPGNEKQHQKSPSTKDDNVLQKRALNAWACSGLSDVKDTLAPADPEIARHTREPQCNPVFVSSGGDRFSKNSCEKLSPELHNGNIKNCSSAKGDRAKMQRSMSKLREVELKKGVIQKGRRAFPEPSYCVRFRMCFCTLDCICCVKNSLQHSAEEVLSTTSDKKYSVVQRSGKNNLSEKRNQTIATDSQNSSPPFDEFYDFSEKSDIPHIALKMFSPKPDLQFSSSNIRNEPTVEENTPTRSTEDDQNMGACSAKWKNGYHRKFFTNELRFARKIGDTEIYYKYGIKRNCTRKSKQSFIAGNERYVQGDEVHSEIAKRENCLGPRSWMPDFERSNDTITDYVAPKKHNSRCEQVCGATGRAVHSLSARHLKRCNVREDFEAQLPTPAHGKTAISTVIATKECMYNAGKKCVSSWAKFEADLPRPQLRTNLGFVALKDVTDEVKDERMIVEKPLLSHTDENRVTKPPDYSITHETTADKEQANRRHFSTVIGRDGYVSDNEVEQRLANNTGTSNGEEAAKVMGNNLRKYKALEDLGLVTKSSEQIFTSATEDVTPVLAEKDGDVTMQNHAKLKVERKEEDECVNLKAETDAIETADSIDMGVARSDSHPTVFEMKHCKKESGQTTINNLEGNSAKSETVSLETANTETRPKRRPGRPRRKAKAELGLKKPCKPAKVTKMVTEEQIASGNSEIGLPVETRSSRRLRSRVKNKRGRYEAEYVTDLPKSMKRPKKVLPTRDYDREDFWQFYRDCEKTRYSKSLILKHKYIKLLKSKEIDSPELNLYSGPHCQYSSVFCASSSLRAEARLVPDDGLMAFMKRYTRPRKTPQELPKVADEHCPYCGRSFVGQEKSVFESHLSRHGMRYTILAAPQVPKKKKRLKNPRKDAGMRKPKSSNSNTTVIVVDPLDNSSAKPTPKPESPLEKPTPSNTEQLRSFKPFPKPSNLSMGHRKQTARKSFSLTSALPKDMLIAALECEMRTQSSMSDKNQAIPSKPVVLKQNAMHSPTKKTREITHAMNSTEHTKLDFTSPLFLPNSNTDRKTLTGLPITYGRLHNTLKSSGNSQSKDN